MSAFRPEEIWIQKSELDTPLVRTVLDRIDGRPVRVFADAREAECDDFARGKRRLVLMRHPGRFLHACPGGTNGVVCCNYLVVNLVSNCPLDCSYCFLQDYVANNPALKAYTNVEDALAEVDRVLRSRPGRTFRVGTGELADSLALDPLTGLSRILIPFFARRGNAWLELKTKTDHIEELLALDPGGRVVVSWSVNAEAIVADDEAGAASLEERIVAARRVSEGGYRVGLHFDPLVEFAGWQEGYRDAIHRIFTAIDAEALAWVSLGTLRLTPALTGVIRKRGIARCILGGELIPAADGKLRLWQGLRIRMYRFVLDEIRARAPRVPVYLCMETPSVWQRVMREVPADRALGLRLACGGV